MALTVTTTDGTSVWLSCLQLREWSRLEGSQAMKTALHTVGSGGSVPFKIMGPAAAKHAMEGSTSGTLRTLKVGHLDDPARICWAFRAQDQKLVVQGAALLHNSTRLRQFQQIGVPRPQPRFRRLRLSGCAGTRRWRWRMAMQNVVNTLPVASNPG